MLSNACATFAVDRSHVMAAWPARGISAAVLGDPGVGVLAAVAAAAAECMRFLAGFAGRFLPPLPATAAAAAATSAVAVTVAAWSQRLRRLSLP